ncbi:FG-GAP-like repeat-containing protein [Marivirga salinae]|uniref:FG-GAP-like repeat-containing protein n=1 Tax=Marivirga salinarum TaxID=3059078 RepID=A0AA51NAU9_9BACT|nr:FG-GAP-like repeat-containing protein [Marivirga sp. BDSF4-3]WMN11743.1 FG-GAP-like repeat-containing protein [Marivirga sp. BDSF4-3]
MKKFSPKYFLLFCLVFFANQVFGQSTFIESVTPKNGYSGQIVNIKGVGLSGADRVFFGSMEGSILSVTDQLIEAEVPSGATYDNVTVFNSTSRLSYSGEHFMLSYGGEQGIESSDLDAQIDVFSQSGLYDVTISDLDGDGKNDIIGANSKSESATILRNLSTPGNISFEKISLSIGASLNTTAGDLNGDGKPEVVFSERDEGNRLIILDNNSTPGNMSFSPQTISLEGSSTKRVVIKDLDLDGKPDLVVSDQGDNKIIIVKNTSSGGVLSFNPDPIELTVDNAVSTAGLEVEDLNGDGKPEIVTNQFQSSSGGFFIATNQSTPGNISFSDFNNINTPGTLINLKVGDFNQDNKPDIVATLFLSSAIAVFNNETTGIGETPQFGSAQNLSTGIRPWGLDFGDMDGDGNKDIVVATVGTDKTINILNNGGSGGLNFSKVDVPVEYINRNVKLGDIDGDSKPDIVFTSVDDDNNNVTASFISILRNNQCIIPVITPEGPINACEGNPVRLETQNIEGLTFEWYQDGNPVKTSTENFIELNDVSASGSYTVSIISDGGSCQEISEEIEVNIISEGALPSATISTNDPICNGGTLNLNSSDVGATEYKWRGPQDYTAEGLSVEINNFNANKAGRYYLDIYSGSCIVETKSIVVEVVSAPNFFAEQSGEGSYCVGESVTLNVSPNESGFNFQWYKGTSAISGATSATYNPTTAGNYYVEITDQVNTFCPKIYSDTLEVAFLEAPQVYYDLPTSACIGIPVSFTNDAEVADESLAQYTWDFGDGNVSSENNPTHTYNTVGTFVVTLEVSYEGIPNCSSELSKQFVVNGELNLALNASNSSLCEGDSAVLSLENTYASYSWDTGETSPTITVNEGGTYSVAVVDENGCEGSSQISIQTSPIPDVSLDASSTTISAGDTVSITAFGLIDYVWSADSTALGFTDDQINYAPSTTTTIRVEGQDENGCYGSAEIVITVEDTNMEDRFTPMKFFSPNNDAIAQYWEVENIENFSQCGVEIYDQQGNKIYESKPYNNDWEGTVNGSPVPDGVYYYVIRCDDVGIAKSGSITLLR